MTPCSLAEFYDFSEECAPSVFRVDKHLWYSKNWRGMLLRIFGKFLSDYTVFSEDNNLRSQSCEKFKSHSLCFSPRVSNVLPLPVSKSSFHHFLNLSFALRPLISIFGHLSTLLYLLSCNLDWVTGYSEFSAPWSKCRDHTSIRPLPSPS
jgi:hypothetical protein